MKVQIKLFALARQRAGRELLEVELPAGATVADLRRALADQMPELAELAGHVLFAVDLQYAQDHTPIPPGAEVACIPPVSGG